MVDDRKVIEIRSLEKRFGAIQAVSRFTLDLQAGEFFSLLGPSGCGKTTALRMIAGFQEPTSGQIVIDGEDMSGVPANRRPTNMVFQSYAIFPHLNVGDNVAYGLRSQRLGKAEINGRVSEALDMVELSGLEKRGATQLSGGQRQRVALARALVMRPRVLLLDEPLSALDRKLREQMQFELRRLQRSLGITFVMVTHDQYEAMTMSDRIGVMFDGRLVQVDAPATLYARPCNRHVAAFVGEMNFLPGRLRTRMDDSLSVDVPGFGALTIPRNPNARSGISSELLLGVRPEQLEIGTTKPKDCDAVAQGDVSDVAFYGENVHYHVCVANLHDPVVVSVPNHFHTVDYRQGDHVWLGMQAASVIELGEDGNQSP